MGLHRPIRQDRPRACHHGRVSAPESETSDATQQAGVYDPAAEVVDICRDLIRIDTTNAGDGDGPGERKAAEHVAALLSEVGIEVTISESDPGRTSLLARWGGVRRLGQAAAAGPRPPRRGAGRRRRLAGAPALRRDQGRLRSGAAARST